jgi:hypothetical protein
MRKLFSIVPSTILLFIILSSGCLKQQEYRPAPTISFVKGTGLVSSDTTAYAGDIVSVGIKCTSNGTDAIQYLSIYANNYLQGSYNIDKALGQGFIDTISFVKSKDTCEFWVIQVVDNQGMGTYIGLKLRLNKTGEAIDEFTNILGAPANTSYKSYYSIATNLGYIADSAQNRQNKIDFLSAYDATNGNYLISPDASSLPAPFDTEMSDWTTKNSTLFCLTDLVSSQFDYITLDRMIINSFPTETEKQKKKTSTLKANDVYAFKLADGRYGLFKVTSITTGSNGRISISVKIQKD